MASETPTESYDECYKKLVVEVSCNDAGEFLDCLAPRGKYFRNSGRGWWAYRGHSKSTYSLLPVAWRNAPEADVLRFNPYAGQPQYSEYRMLQLAELAVLRNFVLGCDRIGLPIPAASTRFFQMLKNSIDELELNWPADEFLPALALARHHGAPTRLLDWTESSYTAAFFASNSALGADDAGLLEVWALNLVEIDQLFRTGVRLSIVRTPRSGNQNLHAQDGLFTMTKPSPFSNASNDNLRMDWRPLDEYVVDHVVGDRRFSIHGPLFYRFTLPRSCSFMLMHYLQQEGVSFPQLMPNYDSVIRDMNYQLSFNERKLGG